MITSLPGATTAHGSLMSTINARGPTLTHRMRIKTLQYQPISRTDGMGNRVERKRRWEEDFAIQHFSLSNLLSPLCTHPPISVWLSLTSSLRFFPLLALRVGLFDIYCAVFSLCRLFPANWCKLNIHVAKEIWIWAMFLNCCTF